MSPFLATLIHNLGLLGVALGAGLEGETAVVIGGAVARHGLLDPVLATIAAGIGSFLADQMIFWIGRTQRDGRLVQRMRSRPGFARALTLIERHPLAFCLGFRFVYGFRIAGPLAIGSSRVPTRRFVLLNAASAALWAIIFTTLGYQFGQAVERALGMLLTPLHLLAAIGIVAATLLLVVLVRRRRGSGQPQRPSR